MQGRRAPSGPAECSGRRRAQENREQLEKLKNRQEEVEEGARALQKQLDLWVLSVQEQIDGVKAQSVLVLKDDVVAAQTGETLCWLLFKESVSQRAQSIELKKNADKCYFVLVMHSRFGQIERFIST